MGFTRAWRAEIDLRRQLFEQARERFAEAQLELSYAREALEQATARLTELEAVDASLERLLGRKP
jgi:hypothetical protein